MGDLLKLREIFMDRNRSDSKYPSVCTGRVNLQRFLYTYIINLVFLIILIHKIDIFKENTI